MDFWKLRDDLRSSFLAAKDRGFTDQQVNLARHCIEQVVHSSDIDVTQRYQMVPFMDLLEKNNYQYPSVIIAYNLLLQYVTNLLAPVLPPNWYSISTKSTTYAFRLARVKGSEDILDIAGYTKRSGDFRTFPEDKRHQPDRENLAMLATELLLARVECEGIVEKKYPKPEARSTQPHPSIQPTYQPASPHTGMPQRHHDSPSFQTSGGYYPSDAAPQYLHAPFSSQDNYLRRGSTEGSSFGFHTHTPDSDHQPPALAQDRFNKPYYPDRQHQQYMEQPSYYDQPTKPYHYNSPTGPDQYSSSIRPSLYNQYDSEPKRLDSGTQSPQLSQERYSRELQDTGGGGGSPYTSGSQQASPPDSHQFSSSHSSGSQNSSPHSSQRFSGPETHSPIPAPDEPLSSSQGEGGDVRRTKLLNRQQALLAKLKKLRADEHDPSAGPAPIGIQTTPVLTKVSESISNLLLKEEPTVMNESVTKAPPVPKPRQQRYKASTSGNLATPSPRFFQNTPMEHSTNIPGACIPQKPSYFEPIAEETTSINQDSTAPMSPIRCPKCKCHLNDAGQCPYCTPHSETTHPLSDPPGPSPRPIPKPRKRTKIFKVNSNETNYPVVAQPNEPSLTESTDLSYLGSPDIPDVGNNITPSRPTISPSNTSVSSHKEPSNTGQSYYSQDSSHGSSGEKVVEDKKEKDQTQDAYQKMHFKYSMEIEHFRRLSVEEQREYLDDKRRYNDPITHLTPYYNGRDLHTRESSKDMEWFSSLTPEQQREELDRRRQKGENVDHLSILIKKQHVFQGLSELEQKHQRQQKLKVDGQYFIYWLKECTPYGFAPEEVEIALQRDYENPLNYLKTQWFKLIKHVQTHVQFHQIDQSLGIPPSNEIRLLLIETNGDHLAAGKKCVANRKEKMDQLFKKLEGKLEVKWNDALESLSACDLDVEAAFYDVQCKSLKGLYDYMTTDYSHIIQGGEKTEGELKTENDYLKEVVMERMAKEDDEALFNSCLRMIMAECRFRTTEKAKMLIDLLKDKDEYPLTYYIDAAKNYNTFEEAQKYLNQPCPICMDDYPMDEMVVMPACDESLCKNCFKDHFKIVITEQSVKHFNCPMCGKPDLSNPDQTQGMNLELFVAMVKVHLEKDVYDMCQKKLTDFNLSKDPNFLWCPHDNCGCGFINERHQNQIQCPGCKESMCSSCKKKWEDQHKGISCEDFAKWKADNDPEAQKAGLAAHLNENGIQCPACKFRYDLARGGCMHFHCTQCPHEFCSGCSSAFKNGEACGRFANCKNIGLHAHHPRDCLFYLRDFSHQELQKILEDNKVEYDTDPPEAQINAAREKQQQEKEAAENEGEQANEEPVVEENIVVEQEQPGIGEEEKEKIVHVIDGEEIHLVCQVMLQKETPDGLRDEECLAAAPQGMAGLCKVHYKEYLVSKINKHNLDPIELYETIKIQQILRRQELEIPEKDEENQESEEDYRKRLIEHVKEQLPIQRDNPNPV